MLLFNTFKSSEEIAITEKVFLLASLGYLIYPLDIIADVLPGEYTDDAVVLIMAICDLAK